jgi:RNA polymerase primary sigma factor
VSPEESGINVSYGWQVDRILHNLEARKCKILELRFGIQDGDEHTLEEVAKEVAVTRERVRQLETKGLRELRQICRRKR